MYATNFTKEMVPSGFVTFPLSTIRRKTSESTFFDSSAFSRNIKSWSKVKAVISKTFFSVFFFTEPDLPPHTHSNTTRKRFRNAGRTYRSGRSSARNGFGNWNTIVISSAENVRIASFNSASVSFIRRLRLNKTHETNIRNRRIIHWNILMRCIVFGGGLGGFGLVFSM